MSIQIRTINLVEKVAIYDRDVELYGRHVQSVNIYQTDGSFITTEPFNNKLIWYPQAPYNAANTALGAWKIFESFVGYGYLSFPLDARFDYTRRILWIADSGNKRILKVNIDSGTVIESINNGYFSHSIVVNINDGSIFVKSIKDRENGIVQHYSKEGILLNSFEFACNYGITEEDITNTYDFASSLPLPYTMVFDHARKRLWWTGDEFVYMTDTINENIIPYHIASHHFHLARGVDVDFDSGNAFVIAKNVSDSNWYILQMFRDNNKIVSTAYLIKDEPSSPPYGGGSGWLGKTIGSASVCSGSFSVNFGGNTVSINGSNPGYFYVYKNVQTPCRLTAKLNTYVQEMEAGLCVDGEYFCGMNWCEFPNGNSYGDFPNDNFLRITVGPTSIFSEHSPNGINWTIMCNRTINVSGSHQIGFFSSLCNNIQFTNIVLERL